MPVIDSSGRVFALVSIVDLLAVLLAVAVVTTASVLLLPQAVARPLAAVVAVGGLAGLMLVSKLRFGVPWSEVRAAMRDAWPSLPSSPYLGGVWHWLTADPELEFIVIDLRETVTVGPVIGVFDLLITVFAAIYRGSGLNRVFASIARHATVLGERTGLSRVAALVARLLTPPEPPIEE